MARLAGLQTVLFIGFIALSSACGLFFAKKVAGAAAMWTSGVMDGLLSFTWTTISRLDH